MAVGTEVRINGIVANLNYTGQSTPYVVGFWLADATGSIYIYGENAAMNVQKGNTVALRGTKTYYIPDTDSAAATATGYVGMQQIIDPVLLELSETVSPIPETAITTTTIADINEIPLGTDISGNIYRVQGRYHRYDSLSYVNYEITDLNRVDSLLAYTQCNGKDYYWTDSYDTKTVELLIIVSLGKPGVGMWRMNPVTFIEEITVTALQEAEYGAQRALDLIADSFDVKTTVEVPVVDELLTGLTRDFTSASSKVTITKGEVNNVLVFDSTEEATFEITATAYFDGQSATAKKNIEFTIAGQFETTSISEARTKEVGETVTIQAIVARLTYKSSLTKQGMFLVDETGTLFVYNDSATQANLASVQEGNKVVVTGTIAHYIKDDTIATTINYTGNLQLSNVTVDNLDTNIYDIPTAPIINGSVEDILATPVTTNISSNIYKMTVVVSKVSTQYYTNYYLNSTTSSSQILLYSQNSGHDYEWLDSYLGSQIQMYVGIQELNLKATGSAWRVCAVAIIPNA